jgi:hypothetical protein
VAIEQPHITAAVDRLLRNAWRLVGWIGFSIEKITQKGVKSRQ